LQQSVGKPYERGIPASRQGRARSKGFFFCNFNDLHQTLETETTISEFYLYKRIVQAKLFIDAHFGEHIDLNKISEEAHFSKFHFIRLFKKAYGRTPHQYLIKVRIDKAKAELERGSSAAQSCFSVGFDSVSTFTGPSGK
jgi:AraC-like DNA-binding protein